MSQRWFQLQSLPKDGMLWMLTWLGPFYQEANLESQRSILAVISEVKGSKNLPFSKILRRRFPTAPQLGRRRLVSFAIGDLPALTIGTMYRDGRPVSRAQSLLTTTKFKLNFDQQEVFRLSKTPPRQAMPVLPKESYLMDVGWPTMALSAGVGLTRGLDPFGVLFPVAEVLRWCYGSSSGLLQALLSDELESVIESVQSKSTRTGDQYHLTLPPSFLHEDAHTLAWLANDDQARQTALHVDRSVMVNRRRTETNLELSSPGLLFPYSGTLVVDVLGRWIVTGSPLHRKRFLVHRILKTGFTLPFEVSLPEPQREPAPTEPQGGESQYRKRATPPARAQSASLISDTEPRRPRTPVRLPALNSQFTGSKLLRSPVDVPPQPATIPVSTEAPTGAFATGTGVDVASRAKRATLVQKSTRSSPESPLLNPGFEMLRKALLILRQKDWTGTLLPLNNPGGSEARFQGWLRANGERVGCLVVHLTNQGSSFYLFDKERLSSDMGGRKEYGPILIAARQDRQSASMDELTELLASRVGRKTWPSARAGWSHTTLPHAFSKAENLAEGVLRKLHRMDAE